VFSSIARLTVPIFNGLLGAVVNLLLPEGEGATTMFSHCAKQSAKAVKGV
jgi:hypothetical protein